MRPGRSRRYSMTDWPLPPFVQPNGPLGSDTEVIAAFVTGDLAPYSPRLHVEGETLMVERDVPAVLRVERAAVLVRADLPDGSTDIKAVIEQVLRENGLTLLDTDTMLAVAVAMQRVGLRLSSWDLWGRDIDEAFASLRRTAAGGQDDILYGGGDLPLGGPSS